MSVIVYKFGVHYRWALPPVLMEQLRLAHDLREDLVSRQMAYEASVKEIWSSYPTVATVEARLAQAEADAETAAVEVSKQRAAQRTKRITGPAVEALRAARSAVKQARTDRRTEIAAVYEDAKSRLDTLQVIHRDLKPLYAEYTARGLYWATFNDVAAHHQVAVRRIAADRAAGKPAALRHHRFDGSGTIAVQLQRVTGAPARTPAALADNAAGRWRNVFTIPWTHPDEWDGLTRSQQRQAGRVTARMRCGDSHIDVPVQVHRMLPSDADVTGVRLTVRRVAGSIRAHLAVTAKVADPVPVTDGPTVAVHLGWRDDESAVTVATWRADQPLDVPFDMRHYFHADSGSRSGTIRLPHRVADRIMRADDGRSERDLKLDALRERLVAWLAHNGPVPHPYRDGEVITAADVARWRSPRRFAVLAHAWRSQSPAAEDGMQMAAALEEWRRSDRAAWESQEHGRDAAIGHRSDLYRQVAAVIADQAGALVIDKTSVAKIAAKDSDLPGDVERRIARRRATSAPGELRAAVVSACTREGVPVTAVDSAGLSRIHAACGHINPADGRYLSRGVHCDGCGSTYDQDESATALMLARASDPEAFPWTTAG